MRRGLCGLVLLLAGGLAYGADGVAPAAVEVATGVGGGVERLVIEDAGALASLASREDGVDGFLLYARVVARAEPGVLRAALGEGGEIAPIAGSPGYWLVEAESVADAVSMAFALQATPGVGEAHVDIERPTALRSVPNDPLFPSQWHLRNTQVLGADANILGAWGMGYTGQGVIVGVIDGGIMQTAHADLAANFVPAASITSGEFVGSHATNVAGVVGAVGDNGVGVAGSAYNAGLGTMSFGAASKNATAFSHRNDLISIKNNSWGPPDNGRLGFWTNVEANSIRNAVNNGRGGLGVVFVWAGGNGGTVDRVDYDNYASSRYTIAVGAINDLDRRSSYSERGSSLLVGAHSDDSGRRSIWTTDRTGNYTNNFGGTSSASPLAAGVVALMLEANPQLSWRDVQHVLVESARKVHPASPQWEVNGAGYDINYDFGFGAVDATAAVTLAETWTPVGEEVSATTGTVQVGVTLPDNNAAGHSVTVTKSESVRIEHVELVLNASTAHVGDLRVRITSPEGTESLLAAPRSDSTSNYSNFVFTSVRHWGELSDGDWTVHIADERPSNIATWNSFELRVHGTDPAEVCRADINGDGVVDADDFFAFLSLFAVGDSAADFNGDGVIDADDFFAFLAEFAAGCA